MPHIDIEMEIRWRLWARLTICFLQMISSAGIFDALRYSTGHALFSIGILPDGRGWFCTPTPTGKRSRRLTEMFLWLSEKIWEKGVRAKSPETRNDWQPLWRRPHEWEPAEGNGSASDGGFTKG